MILFFLGVAALLLAHINVQLLRSRYYLTHDRRTTSEYESKDSLFSAASRRGVEEVEEWDGVPGWVDRFKQRGNAVVPQVVQVIGEAILREEKRVQPV